MTNNNNVPGLIKKSFKFTHLLLCLALSMMFIICSKYLIQKTRQTFFFLVNNLFIFLTNFINHNFNKFSSHPSVSNFFYVFVSSTKLFLNFHLHTLKIIHFSVFTEKISREKKNI